MARIPGYVMREREIRGERMMRYTVWIAGCLWMLFAVACTDTGVEATATLRMERAPVQGGAVEYEVQGSGEPVLLIHGAFIASAFSPLMEEPSLENFRLIRYHRRGFAGSTAPVGLLGQQVDDAAALLRHLDEERAHIVGHSGGGRIALELALSRPEVVQSLTLVEPAGVGSAPSSVSNEGTFRERVIAPATERYQAGDAVGAVNLFMREVLGPRWRTEVARTVPSGVEHAVRDAATFFEGAPATDPEWIFTESEARSLSERAMPMLHMWGTESLVYPEARTELFHSLFPTAEDEIIEGVGHEMQMQAPERIANALGAFLERHPIEGE